MVVVLVAMVAVLAAVESGAADSLVVVVESVSADSVIVVAPAGCEGAMVVVGEGADWSAPSSRAGVDTDAMSPLLSDSCVPHADTATKHAATDARRSARRATPEPAADRGVTSGLSGQRQKRW